MSQENVEAFKRGIEACNRRDIEALLQELHTEVEWYPALEVSLGGEATVYRGHDGVRELIRSTDETLGEIQVEFSKIRDVGDRIVAVGQLRIRGKESGAETKSPVGGVAELKSGKPIRMRTYLDPKEALEAAGLRD
ncbi:MAG TPA: nuclear transport factor 2 family protein [Solirubrobacterales bacterium]